MAGEGPPRLVAFLLPLLSAVSTPVVGGGSPPITMAEFQEGMLHSYSTARDAFAALDADLMDLDAALDEDPVNLHDFKRGTKKFQPPLTDEQATYAFNGFDVNADGVVDVREFVDGIESGGFFRPTTTTTLGHGQKKPAQSDPITMEDFKDRMLRTFKNVPEAFAALDASETDLQAAKDEDPVNLAQFVKGSQAFSPPLSRAQAEFAFQALDADADGILVSAEFSEGLARRNFRGSAVTASLARAAPTTTSKAVEASKTKADTTLISPSLLPISMHEFKVRMLSAHSTPLKAFQMLGANPAGLTDFIRGTKTFQPPLSEDQATYAFQGLDVDHDNSISSFEFFEVLEFGEFFPKLRDLVLMGTKGSEGKPAGGAGDRDRPPRTTTEPPALPGINVLKVVALITACPLLCLVMPLVRRAWERVSATGNRLESYKVVRSHAPPNHRSLATAAQPRPHPRHSRFFGPTNWFSCCVQHGRHESPHFVEDPPVLNEPCMKPMPGSCSLGALQ